MVLVFENFEIFPHFFLLKKIYISIFLTFPFLSHLIFWEQINFEHFLENFFYYFLEQIYFLEYFFEQI